MADMAKGHQEYISQNLYICIYIYSVYTFVWAPDKEPHTHTHKQTLTFIAQLTVRSS